MRAEGKGVWAWEVVQKGERRGEGRRGRGKRVKKGRDRKTWVVGKEAGQEGRKSGGEREKIG